MKFLQVDLQNIFSDKIKHQCTLDCYVSDIYRDDNVIEKRDAVLICPGGGYSRISKREGEPVALAFLGAGFNVFVLNYITSDRETVRFPGQLLQAAAALKYIADNQDSLLVNKDRISLCGFSAGGHLAASLGCMYNNKYVTDVFGALPVKPHKLILSYSVISALEAAHTGSFDNIAGEDKKLREYISMEKRVTKDTPQTFLWHTGDDASVSCKNSLLFAKALIDNEILFEMHIFPKGPHGVSLAVPYTAGGVESKIIPDVAVWFDYAVKFLRTEL